MSKDKINITVESKFEVCGDGCCHDFYEEVVGKLNGKEFINEQIGEFDGYSVERVLKNLGYTVNIEYI